MSQAAPGLPSALILAAGRSTRLGAFKPLADLGGVSLLGRCVELFRAVGVREIVVVAGFRAPEVLAEAARLGAAGVENPDFDHGMLSSVRRGLAALGANAPAAFVLPVDTALVRPPAVRALLDGWTSSQAPGRALVPDFRGQTGHPVLLPADLFPVVLSWDGPEGLRGCLAARARVERRAVADAGTVLDVDVPDDLTAARALCAVHEEAGAPVAAECRALFDVAGAKGAGQKIRAHCLLVARVALRLGAAVNACGGRVGLERLAAAGLTHDLAKGQPDHSAAGAAMLEAQGWPRVARLVATHSWLPDHLPEAADLERDAVFLADKLAAGDRLVSLDERFSAKAAVFADNPAALDGVRARLEQTRRVAERLWTAMGGRDPEAVAAQPVDAERLLAGFVP